MLIANPFLLPWIKHPQTSFPGEHSRLEPPDPISNSEVKHSRADDSVGFPHVKVGHCQGFFLKGDVG
jgi:hypothetical protein